MSRDTKKEGERKHNKIITRWRGVGRGTDTVRNRGKIEGGRDIQTKRETGIRFLQERAFDVEDMVVFGGERGPSLR